LSSLLNFPPKFLHEDHIEAWKLIKKWNFNWVYLWTIILELHTSKQRQQKCSKRRRSSQQQGWLVSSVFFAFGRRGQFHQRSTRSFYLPDPRKRNISVKSSVSFYAFWISMHKSCTKNIDEIDTTYIHECCAKKCWWNRPLILFA